MGVKEKLTNSKYMTFMNIDVADISTNKVGDLNADEIE